MKDSKRPWVAYVGPFGYPDGGAAARRVLGIAESLSLGGLDVVIASGAGQSLQDEGQLVAQGDGIAYCLLAERVAEHWPRPLRRFRYAAMGGRTVAWLAAQPTLPKAVILYSGYTPYLQRLLPWCRRNGVRLLFDAVEWYEPEHPLGYLTSPYQWNIEWAMRYLIPRTDGVIAISSYLTDYYRKCGLPVVQVPPTTSAIAPGARQRDACLRLCYVGKSAYNEELGAVLQAVMALVSQGISIDMTVAGPSRAETLCMMGESSDRELPWLSTPGTLTHPDARKLIGEMDFSIFVRERCRMTQAGFPTKFVESFASGTPVIANVTSDIASHLQEGVTGFVCDGVGIESISSALRRAISLDARHSGKMRQACVDHALSTFHPRVHSHALADLIRSS